MQCMIIFLKSQLCKSGTSDNFWLLLDRLKRKSAKSLGKFFVL